MYCACACFATATKIDQVEDEDPGEEESQSFKRRHILTRDALIPLPKELRYEFPKGAYVSSPSDLVFSLRALLTPP